MLATIIRYQKLMAIGVVLLFGLTISIGSTTPVVGQEADVACQGIAAAGGNCGGGEDEVNNLIQDIINILLYVVGVMAVIVMIVGGIRYVVSGGDQQAVASAKNTIIYAIVGLVVAVLAWVAVNWVFGLVSA